MWLLEFVPNFVFHIITIIGIIGVIASEFFSLFMGPYVTQVRVVSILVLAFGIFMEGALLDNGSWKLKVADAEKQVLAAKAESADTNTKLVEALSKNELLRKDRENETKQIVKNEVSKYDNQCILSNAFVRVHDSASQDRVPDSTGQSDGSPSDVKASEVLNTVTDNYGTCYNIRDKLIKWQEWYKNQSKIYGE